MIKFCFMIGVLGKKNRLAGEENLEPFALNKV